MLQIALHADEEWDSSRPWEKLALHAAEAAIAESAFPHLLTVDRKVEVSVTLAGDEQVRDLNAQWRGKNKATNVLSFPMAEIEDFDRPDLAGQEFLLGDLILAHGICEAEAIEKCVRLEQHVIHLIAHGMLHLLGYDHERNCDAADMEAREIRALARIGIANPYEDAA